MPVYNTIAFTVDSTNKSQCSFKYICDVYVNGVYVTRMKQFPAGANGYAEFKVNRVLEDMISFDINKNLYGSSLFAFCANSLIQYELKFGEEYDSSPQCDSVTTVYPNLTLTSSIKPFYAFNGALQKKEWLNWDYTDRLATGGKFLTSAPENVIINYGEQMVFNIFAGPSNVVKLQVKTYGSVGLIDIYTFTAPSLSSGYKMLACGVGPANLNNSTLATGSQPVISGDIIYYTIQLLDGSNNAASELKTINIDQRITKWAAHRLWWLNRLGAFDSYTFSLADTRDVEISRTEFTKIFGSYRTTSPGAEWSYDLEDRGRQNLEINAQEKESYISNWLTEKEGVWMEQLFTSIEAYRFDQSKHCCFDSFNYYSVVNGLRSDYYFTIPCNLGEVGDNIYLCFDPDSQAAYLTGNYAVVSQTDCSTTIFIGRDCFGDGEICYNEGLYEICGYGAEIPSGLEPIMIRSAAYQTKKKNKVKNINYQIEIEPAHAINIQRN